MGDTAPFRSVTGFTGRIPKEVPPEIKALIDAVLGGFNRKDSALYNSAFGDDVVIIDGTAPYRWTDPNAQGRWFADAEV